MALVTSDKFSETSDSTLRGFGLYALDYGLNYPSDSSQRVTSRRVDIRIRARCACAGSLKSAPYCCLRLEYVRHAQMIIESDEKTLRHRSTFSCHKRSRVTARHSVRMVIVAITCHRGRSSHTSVSQRDRTNWSSADGPRLPSNVQPPSRVSRSNAS